jgi:hypothetical protein
MRAARDDGIPYVVRMFHGGAFTLLPDAVDTALVDAAYDPQTGLAELLMRDETPAFLRDENPITGRQHAVILDAMAAMHAATWELEDSWGMAPATVRWGILSPAFARREQARRPLTGVPAALLPMWGRLAEAAPAAHAVLEPLANDPAPLAQALSSTPKALVHGDFKGGNLGIKPDGRVVLVDWAFCGMDAPCADLAWYLAVNCDRLPESKEQTISTYRAALEAHGVATAPWWDRQLALCLLGGAVQMAWNKCDQPEELAWWADRVAQAASLLP